MSNVGTKNVNLKPPVITPSTNNPAVAMGLKLMNQQLKKKEQEKKKAEKEVKPKRAPIWAVDFEGTITVRSKFPDFGKPNISVIELLKMARLQGVRLILWTCRYGNYLTDAVEWCKDYGLEFDAVNENVPEAIEYLGQDTRKVIADLYIDDKSFHFWGEEGEKRLWQLVQNL